MELSEEVEDELTAVSSILLDAISIDRSNEESDEVCVVSLRLGPLTASRQELSYVEMTLVLKIGRGYPEEALEIEVKSPRGLSEEQTDEIVSKMRERCASFAGFPVIFELVDCCREYLTERNVPSGSCPICLMALASKSAFCKTVCFHYFHSFCLARHVRILEEIEEEKRSDSDVIAVPCPVCREDLAGSMDMERLLEARDEPEDDGDDVDVLPLAHFRRSRELKAMFEKQLRNGGIIDVNAESRRFLVTISSPPPPPPPPDQPSSSNDVAIRPHPPSATLSKKTVSNKPMTSQPNADDVNGGRQGKKKRHRNRRRNINGDKHGDRR